MLTYGGANESSRQAEQSLLQTFCSISYLSRAAGRQSVILADPNHSG